MKLPKNFGGKGFGGMLQQAQSAMARAQQLEEELAAERFTVEKGPVKATIDGTGKLRAIKIDPAAADPEDLELLEDAIVAAIADGFDRATETRNKKVQEIMPNIPGL